MYLWLKAFHIIAMVTWFAGLFYLPRLFVYHSLSDDLPSQTRFKVMERKLYRGIMTPGAVVTVALGLALVWILGPASFTQSRWLPWKLLLVAVLVGYHLYLGHLMRRFAADGNSHGHVFYRWINEFPVLILIVVVCLVVVKPL